jgi:hypothetical protein
MGVWTGTAGSPLLARRGAPTRDVRAKPLTAKAVQPILAEALARWQVVGIAPDRVQALRQVPVHLTDLADAYLGLTAPNTI